MKEFEVQAFKGELSPVFDQFKAHLNDEGDIVNGYNNLYFKVIVTNPDDDEFLKMQFRGESLAAKIADPAESRKFLDLCTQYSQIMRPLVFKNDDNKKAAIISEECNKKLWEIYTLGQKNGLTHADMCE